MTRPGPAAAAALHRGRVPPAFTRLGGKIRRASRAASRSRTSRAAAHSVGPDRHPLRPGDVRHRARARRGRRPRRAPRARPPATRRRHRSDRRALARRLIAARFSSRRAAGAAPARRRHRRDRRRDRDSDRAPLRLRVHRRARTVEAAGPAPYLDCVAAPLTSEVSPPAPAMARRGRGAGGELDHRQPARGLPERGQVRREAELQRVRDQVARRLDRRATASYSRRGRPGARAGRQEPPENHTSLMYKADDLEGRRTAGLRCSTASSRCRPSPRGSSPPHSCYPLGGGGPKIPADAPVHAVERRRSSAAASISYSPPSAGSDASRSSRRSTTPASTSCLNATARTRSGSRSRRASPAPRTSSSPTTRC